MDCRADLVRETVESNVFDVDLSDVEHVTICNDVSPSIYMAAKHDEVDY